MSKINELRQKRGEAWDKAKTFAKEHENEKGILSPENRAEYDRMLQEVEDMGAAIDREERAAELDRELNAPTNMPLTSRPEQAPVARIGTASNEYKAAFWNMMRKRNGINTAINALQVGTDSEGGYLVPDEYEHRLIDSLADANVLRELCTIIRTENGDRRIPLVTGHGTAAWVEEEGLIPESDDTFGMIALGAHKVATIIKVSDELLQDSVFDVEGYITKQFGQRIGGAEEIAFLTGDGVAKPTGLLHETNGAQVGVTTAGASITTDDLLDLVHSVREVYRHKAVFLMNDSTKKAIRKLKDGNGRPLWDPSVREGDPDVLLGHRVIHCAAMPDIGAGAKPILFGDFTGYWIADRQGRSFQRLNELYASTGQIGFKATQRVDGRLVEPEKIKCLQVKA